MTKEIKIVFAYFIILAAVLFGANKVLSDCILGVCEDMYDEGYENMTNIDFSEICIKNMKLEILEH